MATLKEKLKAYRWFVAGYLYAVEKLSEVKDKDIRCEFLNDYYKKIAQAIETEDSTK
jgi:hypothetical protein